MFNEFCPKPAEKLHKTQKRCPLKREDISLYENKGEI